MPMDWRYGVVIIPKYRVAFWTTEKVGCTSQKRALRYTFQTEKPWPITRDSLAVETPFHRIKRKDEYLRVGFLRNPWDRIASAWANKITPDAVLLKELDSQTYFRPGESFSSFVEKVCKRRYQDLDRHLHPQTIRMFYRGERLCKTLLPFEQMEEIWNGWLAKEFKAHTGLNLHPLPHMNESKGKLKAAELWTPYLTALVERYYATDIEWWRKATLNQFWREKAIATND